MKNLRMLLDEMTPSEFIRHRAETLGLSQSGVASELELRGILVSRSSVSMWLSGRRVPRGPKLNMLCQVLAIYGDTRVELLSRIAVMRGMVGGGGEG